MAQPNINYTVAHRQETWVKVMEIREKQLESLTLNELSTVGSESVVNLTNVGPLSFSNEDEWKKCIKGTLQNNFTRACDENLMADERNQSFNLVKAMFASMDRIYAEKDHGETQETTMDEDGPRQTDSGKNNEDQAKKDSNAKENVPSQIEIVTLTDSEDETPTYPYISQNYMLLTKSNMEADIKNTTHSPFSASITTRPPIGITLGNKHEVTPQNIKKVIDRLTKWEPNFIIKENLIVLQTANPLKIPIAWMNTKTCLGFQFTIPQKYASHPNLYWRKTAPPCYKNGDQLLLLRMIPTNIPKKYPDTHMWPKGTFLQINQRPIQLNQRKQQTHDPKLWKSMCYPLDLTPHIDPLARNTLELIAYDDHSYYIHLAIVEYISPENLISSVTKHIPYETSLQQARYYISSQTVKLDDDEDECTQEENNIPLSFTLTCPISMTKISIPVRGRNCSHIQCFDLLTFLSSNSFPCARRWRCVYCEQFTSVDELVICDLFCRLLKRFEGDIEPGEKDKVELKNEHEGGDWELVGHKANKRGGVSEEQEEIASAKKKQIEEIIIL